MKLVIRCAHQERHQTTCWQTQVGVWGKSDQSCLHEHHVGSARDQSLLCLCELFGWLPFDIWGPHRPCFFGSDTEWLSPACKPSIQGTP